MSDAELIWAAFTTCNIVRLASYIPQVIAVARDKNGATAISFSCWGMWIGANATTALYAAHNLGDHTLACLNTFNAACCATVLGLAAYKRLSHARAEREPRQATFVFDGQSIPASRSDRHVPEASPP